MSEWENTITARRIELTELFVGVQVSISFVENENSGRSSYLLAWSDGVANDWYEYYDELYQAMARVTLLAFVDVESTGSGLDRSFSDQNSEHFAQHAEAFVLSRTNR
jgi:hypothetical protein